MSSDAPPLDESPAPTHRAPPEDRRPRSPLAVWALAASIVLAVAGLFAHFLWILLLPALVLAAVALVRIRPQQARGQGMAITALVISLLAGSCQFTLGQTLRDTSERLVGGVLAALASERPEMIEEWLTPEALESGAADRIRARYAAVVEKIGPYGREVRTGGPWAGVSGLLLAPNDVVEIEAGIGEPWSHRTGALWAQARFGNTMVHVEALPGGDDIGRLVTAIEEIQKQGSAHVLQDVRFFRDR